MMNNRIFALLQIFCIVCANPVKRDGVNYQPTLRDLRFDAPVIIVQLPDSSESESTEAHDVPVEFPFDIAKTLDEIFHINRNSMKTEKPLSDFDTATCPNTDIIEHTEAAVEKPRKFKKFNKEMNIDKKLKFEKKKAVKPRKMMHSESEPSVSYSKSSEYSDAQEISMDLFNMQKSQETAKSIGTKKGFSMNEIPRDSKDDLYDESFILKKVNGKPVEGTLKIQKLNDRSSEPTILIGKHDGTSSEQENLAKIEKLEEDEQILKSEILDALASPFNMQIF